MKSKGISPLIAAVILVALVMTVAALFSGFLTDFVRGRIFETEEDTKTLSDCTAITLDIDLSTVNETEDDLSFVLDYKNRRGDANITDLKVVTYDEGGNVETDANVTPAVIQPSIRERVTADQIVSDPVKKVRVFSEQCSEHEIMIQKEEGEWKHASDFKF